MRSLRIKLFWQVGLIIGLFALAMVVINATCLEPYYVWQEKQMLAEQAVIISDLKIGDYSQAALQLEEIEKTRGVLLLILGQDGQRKYVTSFLPEGGALPNPPQSDGQYPLGTPPAGVDPGNGAQPPPALPFELISSQPLPDGSSYQIQQDRRMKVSYLVYRRTLQNGDVLELRVIKNSLQESVVIANRFMLGVGGVMLLLALAWAYRFSKYFTQPILQMNGITRDMANLNFRRKCQVASLDEMGELGRSINHLSDRLDAALTDLQLKNEHLEQDIAKGRKLDQMRREFVQNVSHELKTPICIIQGYAEGLHLNVTRDDAKRLHYAEVIVDEAQKMDKLVHELLQLSQFESGQFPLELCSFDLTQLTASVLDRLEPIFHAQSIAVRNELSGPMFVSADELRTGQVLINYLDNAVAHASLDKQIIISGEEHGDRYRVSVFNDGAHIAGSDLEQIWTSFYKSDKARSREEGRYGLGLSIVRAIQEMHGSAYGVENVLGGVQFWFEVKRSVPMSNSR